MKTVENLRVLGLSKKEEEVLSVLMAGVNTPLAMSRRTKISRPAIYAILEKFKKRELAHSRIVNGKKYWQLNNEKEIENALYATKRALLNIPEGREEIHGRVDSAVVIHRGIPAIKKLMRHLFFEHKNERLYGFQGHVATISWNKIFSTEETNQFNKNVKRNQLITEGILPEHWFEEQTKLLGIQWATDFEGRMARINVIDEKYFEHGGQLWVFKKSLYLTALGEEIVIEVRNSEIQKMIIAIFTFMQDNSRVIDVNTLLRKLIAKDKNDRAHN